MARKLRLEYPGACYHIINRGNYRRDLFATDGAKAAFQACLFEACARSAWHLHAFVVMRNHYHLALETPEGNLVAGMQWLQATFASRFNRLRDERGHLFQGRYKAIVVEEGLPFAGVAAYVHLNPVRAGIRPLDWLAEYRFSSYPFLRQPARRPPWLRLDLTLANAGGLPDTRDGWQRYDEYLQRELQQGPAGRRGARGNLNRGWALGSAEFKAALLRDHTVAALTRAWEVSGAAEIRVGQWETKLAEGLRVIGRSPDELRTRPKGKPWKLALALHLKQTSQASNAWLGGALHLGSAKYVSSLISALRQGRKLPPEYAQLVAATAAGPKLGKKAT